MNDVIRQVLKNLAHLIEARQAVIRHEPLPTIAGHAPQLIQLLQNLTGNGIKYCEADQPVIEITVGASNEDGKQLIKVQDNGIGIPDDKLADVFHPFKRLWSQDTYEGTGLGLAICEKIVKRHGGRIWCKSQTGQGSTFFFTLRDVDVAEDSQRLAVIEATAWYSEKTVRSGSPPFAISSSESPGRVPLSPSMAAVSQIVG